MTRSEAQHAWEKIVDIGFSDYKMLTRDQRVWFNVEPLTLGGLIDHYVNNGAEYNTETIEDLEYLGFEDIADLLRKLNELFSEGKPPVDIDERNDQMEEWDEKYESLTDEIESQFWKRCNDLEKSLLDHINNTGIGKN